MNLILKLVTLGATCLVVGCTAPPETGLDAARADRSTLYFQNASIVTGDVTTQAQALMQAADQLVVNSTIKGAAMGAILGCGLAAASGHGAERCVTQAAVGGAGGALLGRWSGTREVQRRIELVSPNEVARDLQSATHQVAQIQSDIPSVLARHEAELNRLTMALVNGDITQDEHNLAVLKIEAEQIEIVEALEMTARDARRAERNLREAAERGQAGLEWHVEAAGQLAHDVESARASFDFF